MYIKNPLLRSRLQKVTGSTNTNPISYNDLIDKPENIELVVFNESQFITAYNRIITDFKSGIIRLGADIVFTRDHTFSHENIVINCEYNKILIGNYKLTVVGKSCYYYNALFQGSSVAGSVIKFQVNTGVSTNYHFYNCRFHKFTDNSDKIVFDFDGMNGYGHLHLKDCFFTGEVTISSRRTLINCKSTCGIVDLIIFNCRSNPSIASQTRKFGLTGTAASGGTYILHDGSGIFTNDFTPTSISNIRV